MPMQPEIRSFLKKIENELVGIDRKQKKSIIQEIEGHLLEKIEQTQGSDGNELSSKEIKKMLEEFGEPEEISQEYLRQLSDEKISSRGKGKSSAKRVIISLIAIGVVASLLIAGFVYFGGEEKEIEKQIIIEGKGLEDIQIGDSLDKIIGIYSEPEERVNNDQTIWLSYREKKGVDFLLSKQTETIIEIRFNPGFKGNLESGLTLGSTLDSVLDTYNGAKKTLKTNREGLENFIFGSDKVLYEQVDGNGVITTYKFIHDEMGILFWFGKDKNVTQIVVYNPRYGKPDVEADWLRLMQTGDMQNKTIGFFGEPEKEVVTDNTIWMVYHELAGIDFLLDNETKEIIEIRFNEGFDWATINQISIGSSLMDVLNASGGAKKTVKASSLARKNRIYGVDRVLYEQTDGDNKTTSYMFINAPEGILFWLDVNETVTQIVVLEPYSDEVIIREGIGLNYIQIGDDQDKIINLYGEPEKKEETNSTIGMVYHEIAGIDFLLGKESEKIIEIRYNEGFDGGLKNNISIGSSLDMVLEANGGAKKTVSTSFIGRKNLVYGTDRVLYTQIGDDNRTISYMFIDAPAGILFWFDNETVTQIVVFQPHSDEVIIQEGIGLSYIQIGDSINTLMDLYGNPEERVNTNHTIWLSYREKIGIDFLLSGQTEKIIEIRFNVGFPGSLQSDISIGSALDSVLDVYGGAQKTVKTNRDGLENFIFGGNKVMYEQVDENGVITTYKFIHDEMGIIFWFGVDKNVTQIVVYTPYSGKPDIAAEWLGIMQTGDMEERIIGWYGEPEEKVVTDNMIWMVYHDVAGVDFLIDNDTKEVIEVRFNRGFDWATINQISIGSTLIDILNSSGGAKKTVRASYLAHENLIYGVDRVLYEQIDAENITTSYMFINAPEGILFWLDVNETVTQIVIFQPHSKVNIKEGIGLDYVQIRDGLDKIIDLYGEPEIRMEENDTIWLAYREKANIDFLFEDANQTLIEIRFNEGFEGALTNGIRVGSSKEEVLNLSGGANKTVQISANDTLNLSHGSNKVLYEIVDGGNNTVAYKYIDAIRGILYWFDIDGISTQIVVFDPY